MMNVRILTSRDADAWRGYLARLPGADIYHTPEWHAAHEANGEGIARCFVYEQYDELLLYPIMLSEVPDGSACDAVSVYGYSGPLISRSVGLLSFLEPAWFCFERECHARGIVADFMRFNPLSDNWRAMTWGTIRYDRETVAVDLSGSHDDLWARYPSVQRNMVRKAIMRGATGGEIPPASGIEAFADLYEQTMRRNGAAERYLFRPAYWRALVGGLGEKLRLFEVHDGDTGEVLAAALFLVYRDRMHYHLATSTERGREVAASNLLLHKAAWWGQENGCRILHLGGGRTADPKDSLLRFKASIGTLRLPFYVGSRVHDVAVYERLCREWRERNPGVEAGDFFPAYRMEVESCQ